MFKNNKNLLIIALIAVVNALGYGIIIPILYSYSLKFGLSDFQNGLLFALFSLCQFASTPIIGRLSDTYGRKPLLVISLVGTFLSFVLMAFAPSAIFLFIARALDGITAGNIPVASAVISDTTEPKDRAKGFGIIGAAFGFGFVFGPVISALTSPLGQNVPFLIAAFITAIAVVLTALMLPETNKHIGQISEHKMFDFKNLISHLFDDRVGKTLLISLFCSFAFSLLIYAYQPYSVKGLHLSVQTISIIFSMIGIIGFVCQIFVIPKIVKKFGERASLMYALSLLTITFFGFGISTTLFMFTIVTAIFAVANSFVNPLIQTLLSKEVDVKSQGTIQGVNSSYMSVGMIVGPILGGAVASFSIRMPFIVGGLIAVVCVYFAMSLLKQKLSPEVLAP